jgi:hypothetical protein
MTFTTLGTKFYITTDGGSDILLVHVSAAMTPGADGGNWTYQEKIPYQNWIKALQGLNYADSTINHSHLN